MKEVRFGITGSGYMARTHAEAIRRLGSAARLVAFWGGSRAPDLAARYGVDCERTAEGLAKRPDIDAIVVTTPHPLHARETMLALEAGKHVLVEKPMATTLEDCDRMVDTAARRGLILAVGYTLRFRNNAPRARDLIAAGAIGRVLTMHYSMIRRMDDNFGGNKLAWMSSPDAVGFLIDGLPHGIDLIRWLTGAEARTVAGFSRTFLPGRAVEDSTVGLIEFSNGSICSLNVTNAATGPYPGEEARLSMIGSAGILDLNAFGDLHLSDRAGGWRVVSSQPPVPFADPDAAFTAVERMQAFYDQMQSFVDGIQGKPMRAGTGADGRAAVAVCLALLASSREHRLVPVP
ncbi:MAG: Gfo/Idh/MocA family oxidoreductase [Chloroflexi bacterium]|nr:Gfo/Idh/MocA family oxidoreductase [Chloroflexota bacterium]